VKDDVLVTISRDPLFGHSREDYVVLLKRRLAGRVEEAYFFGSFADGDFNKYSDIDMILVQETDLPFHERALAFSDLLDLVPTTDIMVYTRAELTRLIDEGASGFWKSVRGSMKRFF
jgi:uncharacterized protein